MISFLDEEFLLHSEATRELYHEHAEPQPVFDYHCHLSPRLIAENHRFENLHDIWLAGDHYKWRAMRVTAFPSATARGMRLRSRNSSPSRAPCQKHCAILFIIGPTWN